MPDLSVGRNYPNPFGLEVQHFNYDDESYVIALRTLGEIANGEDEIEAVTREGGNIAMLRSWDGHPIVRRVLAKCRLAGKAERAHALERAKREAE